MTEIKRNYRQSLPAMKLVGRCYGEKDRVNGTFSDKWGEWFANRLFEPLKLNDGAAEPFEDCDAYIGLCLCKEGEPFRYWIGVFMPPDAVVPEGYESLSFDAGDIAVFWIYGKEPEVYLASCNGSLEAAGYEHRPVQGACMCFERYVCPRFTEPDENGNIILDICYFVK